MLKFSNKYKNFKCPHIDVLQKAALYIKLAIKVETRCREKDKLNSVNQIKKVKNRYMNIDV